MKRTVSMLLVVVLLLGVVGGCASVQRAWNWATSPAAPAVPGGPASPSPLDNLTSILGVISPLAAPVPWAGLILSAVIAVLKGLQAAKLQGPATVASVLVPVVQELRKDPTIAAALPDKIRAVAASLLVPLADYNTSVTTIKADQAIASVAPTSAPSVK